MILKLTTHIILLFIHDTERIQKFIHYYTAFVDFDTFGDFFDDFEVFELFVLLFDDFELFEDFDCFTSVSATGDKVGVNPPPHLQHA